MNAAGIRSAAKKWLLHETDADYAEVIASLLARSDASSNDDLAALFAVPLTFGTAGLRGALGPGPARMNRRVVELATIGVAEYVWSAVPSGPDRGVVIGYDARHCSDEFAKQAAATLAERGIRVHLLPRALPTPLVPYALRALDAAAGIMITASHNPANDNGYKLYDQSGVQALPDVCSVVEEVMANNAAHATRIARELALVTTVAEDLITEYRTHVKNSFAPAKPSKLVIGYSALHGVGAEQLLQLFQESGFDGVYPVASQCTPNGDFPGLPFPNPEEPGVLSELLSLATSRHADLAIANDPDADRLAVAVPDQNGWRVLTGDEIGWLLGYAMLARSSTPVAVATTVTSSSRLFDIAEYFSSHCIETLTGFKWIARAGRPGRLLFGYEEALGYTVDPTVVGDKDGLSAALVLCTLADQLHQSGRTLVDLLVELDELFGVCVTTATSVRLASAPSLDVLDRALDALPVEFTLAGFTLQKAHDLRVASEDLPATPGQRLYFVDAVGNALRVVVRPSGTESKVKCYVEVKQPVGLGSPHRAHLIAATTLAAIEQWVASAFC